MNQRGLTDGDGKGVREIMKMLLHIEDLQACGIANNWTTLNRRIRGQGFPAGRMIGRRRCWTEHEVFGWIESRPTENTAPLRGFAKAHAEARIRKAEAA